MEVRSLEPKAEIIIAFMFAMAMPMYAGDLKNEAVQPFRWQFVYADIMTGVLGMSMIMLVLVLFCSLMAYGIQTQRRMVVKYTMYCASGLVGLIGGFAVVMSRVV
jgi:hypothetical protein